MSCRLIVIGAGPGGLVSARLIARAGVTFNLACSFKQMLHLRTNQLEAVVGRFELTGLGFIQGPSID